MLTSRSAALCGLPSIPPGSFRHRGCRLPSLPAGRLSLPSRARATVCRVVSRQAITPVGTKLLRGRIALHPLRGERQSLPRTRSGVRASPAETGEGSSGQPIPTHPHLPVLSHSSPRVPAPTPRSAAIAELESILLLQDHQTRRHRKHMQSATGHFPPKTGHIRPETGHIRQESGHIGSDGVDTCLDQRNLNLGLSRIRR